MKCIVNLLGHLAADPQIETLPDGRRIAVLRVVTQETWTDEAGERRSRPTTHRVVVRQTGRVKAIARILKAGALVDVTGALAYPGAGPSAPDQAEIQVRAAFHTILFVESDPPTPGG